MGTTRCTMSRLLWLGVAVLIGVVAAGCYSVLPTDDDGSEVNDGMCPAYLGYDLSRPDDHSESENGWEVFATARRGRNVLAWGEPPVVGVTGYIVSRTSSALDLSSIYGLGSSQLSARTFVVNQLPGEGGWTDTADVDPCTRYRYRVFPVTADGIGYPADPVEIRSLPPKYPDAPAASLTMVNDIEVRPTTVGARLTWELPKDPSRKGILVQVHVNYNGHPSRFAEAVVLPHDATSHMVLTRGFETDPYPHRYCYDVGMFNDFWAHELGSRKACVSSTEMVHCRMTTEDVSQFGYPPTISFRACEEAHTQVVRRELTADGFRVSKIDQPCAWTPSEYYGGGEHNLHEGTLKCEYEDTSVKPGTWYVYELTQTYADGREFTSHHEIVTRARVEMP